MNFIEPTLPEILKYLKNLKTDTKPEWGSMSAIGMIEHISDSLIVAIGQNPDVALKTPEDRLERVRQFLFSDHPLPHDAKAPYGNPDEANRHSSLEDAIAELESRWHEFEKHFMDNPKSEKMHPSFGMLDHQGWLQLHRKHLTHHFQQFGLIPS